MQANFGGASNEVAPKNLWFAVTQKWLIWQLLSM